MIELDWEHEARDLWTARFKDLFFFIDLDGLTYGLHVCKEAQVLYWARQLPTLEESKQEASLWLMYQNMDNI
jgi:hypothetical protein